MNCKLTLPNLLQNSYNQFKNNLSLNFVENGHKTYSDLFHDVISLSNFLLNNGIKKGDKIAILSTNMPQWGISQFAITYIGAIVIPILPGFSKSEIKNILEHSESKLLFVSKSLYNIAESIKTSYLQGKILIDTFAVIPEQCLFEDLDKLQPNFYSNNDPISENIEINEEDTASIIYTSGTTGFSKGVELSHKNIVWNAQQCQTIQPINSNDRFLSILPMAHTYENTLGLLLPIMCGAQIYYLDKVPTPKLLIPAINKIHPTVILSVPLIIEKIYRKQILPVFQTNTTLRTLYKIRPCQLLLNRIAGKKLKQTFGNQLKFFGIGGSKLDPIVEKFLHDAKFPYGIGYGLTETSPLSAGSHPSQTFLQGVGKVMEGVDIKINNPNTDNIGEIWIKGPHVMKGYYKQPELTSSVITPEGWFKTGDLGSFDKYQRLSIRGRIKTMILGSSGENIYPEEIESVINNFRFVNESLVIETKGKLIAMVNFNMEELEKQYEKIKKQTENYYLHINDYVENLKIELHKYVNHHVNQFSQLQLIKIQNEPFEKTATHKIKRFLYQK